MARYDVIVVGLGAFGSAATFHLARRGARVLGIDRHVPPHRLGSSHGETRITRAAIGEGVEFSQLAIRSHQLWRSLESETGENLFTQCGCLLISGHPARSSMHDVGDFFENVRQAARLHHIELEEFDSGEAIRRRYPQFAAADFERGLLDPEGGYVCPEACIRAQLRLAEASGATIKTGEQVRSFNVSSGGASVVTTAGETYAADRLLLAAGAWLPRLLGPALGNTFRVTRQVLHWFEIRTNAARFDPSVCPVYIWEVNRPAVVYGFPSLGNAEAGIKIAHEEDAGDVDPDAIQRSVSSEEIDYMYRTYVAPFFPDLGPRSLRTEVCMYTKAPKARFVIDAHPDHARVMFISACSGHGFKHSAAVGEAVAERLLGLPCSHVDLAPFDLRHLAQFVEAR